MKNLLKGFLFLTLIGTIMIGCEKEDSNDVAAAETVTPQKSSKQNDKRPSWWKLKIKKGSHNENGTCGLSLPCGPCGGMCIKWQISNPAVYAPTATLTSPEIGDGISFVGVDMPSSNEMTLSLTDNSNIFTNGNLEFENDVDLGANIATHFGYTSISIDAGTYSVDYTTISEGEITVDVTTN